jgi:hypothetical protein
LNEADTPQASVDPDLEEALINSVAADPAHYWAVREHLPALASDVFAARREAWDQLARAIESGASTADVASVGPRCADPIEAAEHLTELHWRRVLARLAEGALQDLAAARPARHVAEALAAGPLACWTTISLPTFSAGYP